MGRPPAELSPELQDVLALYTAGYRPVEIAQRSGRTRAWANRAVQRLRQMGAIDADQHVPTGRAKSGAVTVPVRLEAEEVALVESVLREGETVRSFARTAVVGLVTRRKLGAETRRPASCTCVGHQHQGGVAGCYFGGTLVPACPCTWRGDD